MHDIWLVPTCLILIQPLESSHKYASSRPNGCAYCNTDDHKWFAYPRINGCKRHTAEAKAIPSKSRPHCPNIRRTTLSNIPETENLEIDLNTNTDN